MGVSQQEAIKNVQKLFTQLKNKNDELERKINKYEGVSELKQNMHKLQDAIDVMESKMQTPNFGTKNIDIEKGLFEVKREHKEAFDKFARNGVDSVTPEELKTMTVQNDTTGGYLASFDYDNQIIKGLVESSPIRQLCRATTTSKRGIHIPVRNSVPSAYWTDVREEAEESNSSYGLKELENHSMSAKIIIHQDDLDDSDFNMQSEIIMDATEQFAVLEGKGFLTGDTKKKPEGILFNDAISDLESTGNGAISGDDLVKLFYKIKTGYSSNGTWIMNRNTIRDIRLLKDGQGRYLWTPMGGIEGLAYNSILGRPYREMVDMPDVASGSLAIAFGDFNRGYRISDRKGITTVRDSITKAGTREVIFYFHKRVGGMVTLSEAITRLKIK